MPIAVYSSSDPSIADTDFAHFALTHSNILSSGFPTHTGSLPTANCNDATVAPAAGNTPSDVAYMFAAMKWHSGEVDRYQDAFDSLVYVIAVSRPQTTAETAGSGVKEERENGVVVQSAGS